SASKRAVASSPEARASSVSTTSASDTAVSESVIEAQPTARDPTVVEGRSMTASMQCERQPAGKSFPPGAHNLAYEPLQGRLDDQLECFGLGDRCPSRH